MKNFMEKSIDASRKYLEHRGYDILDEGYLAMDGNRIDIVAKDGDAIVFVDVIARESCESSFPREDTSERARETHERAAIMWLAEHADEGPDVQVRFDVVSLLVLGSDRALIRHHINCFGSTNLSADPILAMEEAPKHIVHPAEPEPACATA